MMLFEVRPIGRVQSPLESRAEAPRQGDEGAPEARLLFDEDIAAGLSHIRAGAELIVLTWLHEADRAVLSTHPRSDPSRPVEGVFSTRSPDRPNPVGLHRVRVLEVDGTMLRVSAIEAIDGTPIIDLKPVLRSVDER
jgi:tRNA-Thr(GGU) m(6)t(6)A37 methyltransferase TsaA